MPAQDGTGPEGRGPLTGRGLGPCRREPGFRRGLGRGVGRGFGYRRFWSQAPAQPAYPETDLTKEEQIKILEEESKVIGEELKAVKEKLEELKK